MATIQLQELIPVITPVGKGYAILVETASHDHYWTVALNNGALVTFRQEQIKLARSYTHNRGISDEEMGWIVNGEQQHD